MGRKKIPGLTNRGGVWHIDKKIRGHRVCESTGEHSLEKAEEYLAKRIEETRKALIYGERPRRNFRQAATKYLNENQRKKSIGDDALHLKQLDQFGIGCGAAHSQHRRFGMAGRHWPYLARAFTEDQTAQSDRCA